MALENGMMPPRLAPALPGSARAPEYARVFKPSVFIPAHHDAARDGLWRPTEPVFQQLKDDNPRLTTVSKGYREPLCLNVG